MNGAGSPGSGELLQLCWFTVSGEDYVIDIMRIKEIINPLQVRKVPRAPDFVEGVIDLRGTIIPVVDLRDRLGGARTNETRATKFIIVTVGGQFVGLVVDSVREVLRIAPADLKAAPELSQHEESPLVQGVCTRDDRLLVMLDLDHLLSDVESSALTHLGQLRGAHHVSGMVDNGEDA